MPLRADRTASRKKSTICEENDAKERWQGEGHKTVTGHEHWKWHSQPSSLDMKRQWKETPSCAQVLTMASMRALRSSSSFFFLIFSRSCLASANDCKKVSKMPKNSSGCILPSLSPKCFSALAYCQGGRKHKSNN